MITSQVDNARTGANLHETVLTPRNVNINTFGKLFTLNVDGDVYAQPLVLPHVTIAGKGEHDLVFVATEHDSVYAFDAKGQPTKPLWKRAFVDDARHIEPVDSSSVNCPFLRPEIGITSTPVIDPQSGTLYVLVRTSEIDAQGTKRFWQRLHALSVSTGEEKFGGPVVIRASVQSKSHGVLGLFSGTVEFAALHENPRASLTLANGKVYLVWASSCDLPPYHGWVIAYDAHTLKQVGVLNTSPDATESGIWQSDAGPAVDSAGNLYVATGNGKFDGNSGGRDYGDTLLKIATGPGGLKVADYFTPSEQEKLNSTDADLGSGGPLLIPDQPGSNTHLAVVGGKGAVIYVINRDAMGKWAAGSNPQAVQTIKVGGPIFSAPAYWNGHLYYAPSNDVLKDFAVKGGRLSNDPVRGKYGIDDPGATPSISANGTEDSIVWLVEARPFALLSAYEAKNVTNQIYTSEQNQARDRCGVSRRFVIPVIAGGRVYVAGGGMITVYGLLGTEGGGKKSAKTQAAVNPL